MCAGQFENVAEVMNEEHAWFDFISARHAIHVQVDGFFHELDPYTVAL
jgi:hypothetical protein